MNWALIAGGSRGIGLSIAKALARRNYNLLLVARSEEILLNVKKELENQFQVQIEIFSCDLSVSGSAKLVLGYCAGKGMAINILCNNVGMGGVKDFPDLSTDDLSNMIRLNIESAIVLSSLFIPSLKKTAPSYILNVSSLAGFSPIPIKSVYSSSKSALISFSYSLKYILKTYHISVSCLCPGPVFTKISIKEETIKQMGWVGRRLLVKSDEVGEYAVRQMLHHKMIIVPGKLATIFSYILKVLPQQLVARIIYNKHTKRN